MKYSLGFVLFVGIQLCIIVLEIYKHYQHTQILFALQKAEQVKQDLIKVKQQRICALERAQNLSDIEKFATDQLGLSTIRLPQVRTISHNDTCHDNAGT